MDLADVAKLSKQRDTLVLDGDFVRSIVDLLDADGVSITCVDGAGVVFNWDKLPLIVKKWTSTSATTDKPYCKRWS